MITIALVLLGEFGRCSGTRQEDTWAQLWTELERLRSGEASSAESELLRTHLSEATSANRGEARGELLHAAFESLSGREGASVALRLAVQRPDPFTPREHWFLADLLPRGPVRARAVLAALGGPSAPTKWQLLLAWNVAVDEARALRLEETALPIQENLNQRYAADWSAADLALTYRQLGQRDSAEETLQESISREQAAGRPTADLWSQRGIIALGFGDESAARDYLGKALTQGSDDAALMLSRMELMAGHLDAARTGFRALMSNQPPQDWAWRGWGTTLLPSAFAAPATRTPSPPIQ